MYSYLCNEGGGAVLRINRKFMSSRRKRSRGDTVQIQTLVSTEWAVQPTEWAQSRGGLPAAGREAEGGWGGGGGGGRRGGGGCARTFALSPALAGRRTYALIAFTTRPSPRSTSTSTSTSTLDPSHRTSHAGHRPSGACRPCCPCCWGHGAWAWACPSESECHCTTRESVRAKH
jgi:hypothetical protein